MANKRVSIEQHKGFLSGFELTGKRLPNGKIQSYLTNEILDKWPEEVEAFGHVYTYETVEKGADGYEAAQYV